MIYENICNKALIYLIRRIVEKQNIDALVVAGDIAPKGFYRLFDNALSHWLGDGCFCRIRYNRVNVQKAGKQSCVQNGLCFRWFLGDYAYCRLAFWFDTERIY